MVASSWVVVSEENIIPNQSCSVRAKDRTSSAKSKGVDGFLAEGIQDSAHMHMGR